MQETTPIAKMHWMSLTPRLYRLYIPKKSVERIIWHKNHATQYGVITHPFDATS